MHELSLCKDLVEMVEKTMRKHGARRVESVNVRLGAFSHLQPAALSFCFDAATDGTPVSGARLAIDLIPAKGKCQKCGNEQIMSERFEACKKCSDFPLNVEHADEMMLSSIEVV